MRTEHLACVTILSIVVLVAHASGAARNSERYAMRGTVLKVAPSHKSFIVSHDSIPGVMAAMTMAFDVRAPKDLDGVVPGATVEFTLVLEKRISVCRARADSALRDRGAGSADGTAVETAEGNDQRAIINGKAVDNRPGCTRLHLDRSDSPFRDALLLSWQGSGDQFHLHELRPAAVLFSHRE
jgi:Cu/Ag efflux protein CusF